jgi:hypothetical protein
MGPFDHEKQAQRIESIERIVKNKKIKKEVRDMWSRILKRIALTEEDYNARVMYHYRDFPKKRLIEDV